MKMKLAQRWQHLKAAVAGSTSFDAMNHEMVRRVFAGGATSAGKMVTTDSAMGVSAAWACMRVLSETIGSVPWAVYERTEDGNSEKVADHPLSDLLLHSPNAHMTSIELKETLALNLCQAGNSYSKIARSGERITALFPVPSAACAPVLRKDGSVIYKITENGVPVEYAQRDIWHVKGFGNNGLIGLSPLGAAREALGFAMATEEFGAKFFSQGGAPSGIVTVPNFLKDDQRKIARENLQQMMGGLGNAHKFALFEGGLKPEPWADMPLDDMQFLLLRKFSVQEMCRFYRVPPHMVADLERATFSNIEQQSLDFVMYTLLPYFTRIEASAAKWLMTVEERRRYFLRFNFEGMLRADSTARVAFYNGALTNGWMSRNEVRAKENLNKIAGLDGYTVQSAMIDIEDMGKNMPAPKVAGAPEAAPDDAVKALLKTLDAHAAPQPANNESGVQVVFPEEVTRQMKYNIDHPGIREIAESTKQMEERTEARVKALERATQKQLDRLEEAMVEGIAEANAMVLRRVEEATTAAAKEMVRVARLPRKPVFHSDGEIAGAEVVESLNIH